MSGAQPAAPGRAAQNAKETAQPGGTRGLSATKSDGRTSVWSVETTARNAPVPHNRIEKRRNRVHMGGGGIQPDPVARPKLTPKALERTPENRKRSPGKQKSAG